MRVACKPPRLGCGLDLGRRLPGPQRGRSCWHVGLQRWQSYHHRRMVVKPCVWVLHYPELLVARRVRFLGVWVDLLERRSVVACPTGSHVYVACFCCLVCGEFGIAPVFPPPANSRVFPRPTPRPRPATVGC
jgi:hypothetical protein